MMVEHSTDVIARHTLDGAYLYASPSSENLLGYTPEELMGKNVFELFHPEDRESCLPLREMSHSGKSIKSAKSSAGVKFQTPGSG